MSVTPHAHNLDLARVGLHVQSDHELAARLPYANASLPRSPEVTGIGRQVSGEQALRPLSYRYEASQESGASRCPLRL